METESNFPVSVSDPATASTASITRRITKGFGALSLGAGVQLIGQVSIVPVALYAWGKVRYGEWILLTGFVTVLKLADLGLQTFVVNRMCASYARGEGDEMQRELHSALRIQIPLVLVVAVVGASIFFSTSLNRALDLETISHGTFALVATVLTYELLLGVPLGLIAGVYRATGRLPRAAMIGAIQQFAVVALTVLFLISQAGFVVLASVRLGVALVTAVWMLSDLRRLYPWLRLWPSEGALGVGLRMVGPGVFFLLIPIADFLSNQFTLIVLQRTLAGGEVSRLATHRTVVNLAMLVSGLLTSAVWPELTSLHARSQTPQLIKAHRSLARLNMWLVALVAFAMLAFLPLVYPSWTAGRLTVDPLTLTFLIIRMLVWGTWSASMITLCAINKQKVVAYAVIGAATLTSLSSIWLVPRIGISGAALAQLCGDLLVSAWLVPFFACHELRDRFRDFLGEIASAGFKGIIIPVALGLLGWRIIHSGVVRYAILVPVVFALALLLMWKQLAAYEREHLVSLVKARFSYT